MAKNKPFNGHASWNAWNVSLWINNDEGMYRLARSCVRDHKNRKDAAECFMSLRPSDKTPDGVPYSVTTIRAAMRGM